MRNTFVLPQHRRKQKNIFCVLLFLFFALLLPECAFADEAKPIFRIEIPLQTGAPVTVIDNTGQQHVTGYVNKLPTTTRWPSYTASAWGKPGDVCASAVNAIHMLVSLEKGQGRTMSLIPQETIAPAAGAGASFVLSTKAGTGIFGAWAPPSGSQVFVRKPSGQEDALSGENLPKQGDVLVIRVSEKELPYYVEIENRPGGRVFSWSRSGVTQIGRVLKPVSGVGRFDGTLFQRRNALRVSHPGVIDISTSDTGKIGGFQIIPWDHALTSKEMQNVWTATQWMIIGPNDGRSKLGGTYPLFGNALLPGPAAGETLWDMWSTYGRKSMILARIDGGDWQNLPSVFGKVDHALQDITHLRIYYPITEEPQKGETE